MPTVHDLSRWSPPDAAPSSGNHANATIYDIARALALSPSTVSRVLNGNAIISQETRDRVLEEAASLGYLLRARVQRPGPRQDLVARTAPMVCVLGNTDQGGLNTDVYQQVLQGIEQSCATHRFRLSFRTLTARRHHVPAGMGGYILLGGRYTIASKSKRAPIVRVMGAASQLPVGDLVSYDDAEVGYLAYRHLTRVFAQRLVLVNQRDNPATRERCATFRRLTRKHGAVLHDLDLPLRLAQLGRYRTDQEALAPLRDLLRAERGQKTGIFVTEDLHVPAVMGLCEAEGFCTRENLSVVTVNPGTTTRQFGADILSTIDIKAQEIGRRAVDLIAWRHAHPSAGPVQRVIIPELAAPPAGG